MWKRFLYVVFILFCLEIGLFLVILPWSDFWDRNGFLFLLPRLRPYLISNYVRGGLTGLGLINIWMGLSDIWHFRARLARLEEEEARLVNRNAAPPK